MSGIENLYLFIASGILLNILPGPDSLYVIGNSASQGFRAGTVAALGISAGILVHILAAALGLSAILATSSTAFTAVKILGCVYLVYLGLTLILSKDGTIADQIVVVSKRPLGKIFYQGLLTNVLNPKVALFFLAFVPQFIAADAANKALAFVLLGLIFIFSGMIWCLLLAVFAASISARFRQNSRVSLWLKRIAGGLFAFFGFRLAVSGQ